MGGGAGDEESINAIDVRGGREKQANAAASATWNSISALRTNFLALQNCAMHRAIVEYSVFGVCGQQAGALVCRRSQRRASGLKLPCMLASAPASLC
jgi:hypothetical protein